MVKHRHNEISEDGPGWAVFEYPEDGPKPGRWASKEEAHEHGNCGRYLLSGLDVDWTED